MSVARAFSAPAARVLALVVLSAVIVGLRLAVLDIGSPFITIDDKTAYEGGFLVWFGHAPPQRMYLESWLYGLVSVAVFVSRALSGAVAGGLDVDLVARAYRDFYAHPEPYVWWYRLFTLGVDLGTGLCVYRIAVQCLRDRWRGWAAVCATAMYLLSYNTLWSGVVARPDSVLALLSCLGVLLYLKSDTGRLHSAFLASALVLGAAAGMKLHGAVFAAFVCVDLLRVHGVAAGLRKACVFAPVAAFFFCVSAGSPIFDPLTYVKLRVENVTADRSPWIHWSDHFVTVLRGAGWFALPLAAVGAALVLGRRAITSFDQRLRSVLVLAAAWLLVFLVLRPLRAYWMLPALPLFYILAIHAATSARRVATGAAVAVVLLVTLSAQYVSQFNELRAGRFNELRDWVVAHAAGRPFYVLGDDSLILPKNTVALRRMSRLLEQTIHEDVVAGMPYTLRHVKNWEESSALELIDMLGYANEPGYEFYDYFSAPPQRLNALLPLESLQYVLVQDRFDLSLVPVLRGLLAAQYRPVAEKYGAGGGELGLKFTIYGRR